jgi:Ca2+/Na+ antiporter
MRTLSWVIALLANLGVIAAFAPSTIEGDIVGISASALFLAIGALLVAARLGRLPYWGHKSMLFLCLAVPVLAFVGSLDLGIISGQEFVSIVVAVLLGLGSWRAFLLFAPRPNPAVKRDAPQAARS